MTAGASAWHAGRTFYACPCGAQAETHIDMVPTPPLTLGCYERDCKAPDGMRQWVPPSIARTMDA